MVIDSTFGEKEYVLDKIKNGVRFELPKYKSALQYQEKTMYAMYSQTTKVKSYLLL